MSERLQKFLANAGVASRRKCEEYILQGKVRVNGILITSLGTKVESQDEVKYNNKVIKAETKEDLIYIMLNKPLGYVTTLSDEKGRKTIMELVDVNKRVVPIGRLDMFTSGMLLLTNDGDFVYELTHPKHEISKTYELCVNGKLSKEEISILENPMDIEGYMTKGAKVKIIENMSDRTKLNITISEGRNRQVRKMIENISHRVLYLKRIAIGNLVMEHLGLGKWKYLKQSDIKKIMSNL